MPDPKAGIDISTDISGSLGSSTCGASMMCCCSVTTGRSVRALFGS